MYLLGISCFYHDSSATLIKDGEIVAAAQEERFNRDKASSAFPLQAINFCLSQAQITVDDLSAVVFYEKPYLKFERVIKDHLTAYPASLSNFLRSIPQWLQDRLSLPLKIKDKLGYEGKILYVPHHLSHAASAFYVSPFEDAAIITADAVGEYDTLVVGIGHGEQISLDKKLTYPNSIGLLYTAISTYLGFKANTGEGKVMAFAALGKPNYREEFEQLVEVKEDGSFNLNPAYFSFNSGQQMYRRKLIELLGPNREAGQTYQRQIEQRYYDIAATLQAVTEEIILKIARNLYEETQLKSLCLAGGVFLNCVANTRILHETPFEEVFIQPAAGDAGGSLGAAYYAYHHFFEQERSDYVMEDAFLGPEYNDHQVLPVLRRNQVDYYEMNDQNLVEFVAEKVKENKIVGWFQGRMEFGPRALGHRTILANACDSEMKDLLNDKVKHREWFRPYGIFIPEDEVINYFQEEITNPFMLMIGHVKPEKEELIPSALHLDGTSRLQAISKKHHGLIYDIVAEFGHLTGVPVMINTSFNDSGESIVCSPEDAYRCFTQTGMDILVMNNYVIEKN